MRVVRAPSLHRTSNGQVLPQSGVRWRRGECGRTSACQRLGKVRKVDVCSEICMAGTIKRVGECMVLKGLNKHQVGLTRRITVMGVHIRGMSCLQHDLCHSLLLTHCPLRPGKLACQACVRFGRRPLRPRYAHPSGERQNVVKRRQVTLKLVKGPSRE